MTSRSGGPFDPSVTTRPGRLESWKEIAAYLNRSISTVQRWEQEEELPVHRLLHSKAGSVYALPGELDDWYSRRDPRLDAGEPAEAATPVIHLVPHAPAPVAPSHGPAAVPRGSPQVAAAIAVREPLAPTAPAVDPTVPIAAPATSRRRTLALVLLPLVALVAALGALVAWQLLPTRPPSHVHAEIAVTPADELNAGGAGYTVLTPGGARTALAWTPDGQKLVFVGRRNRRRQLYVRDLARADAYALPDTEGAAGPAVDPDGRSVVFWARGEIRRVPLGGGPAQTVARNVPWPPAGLSVGQSGRVVFSSGDPPSTPLTEVLWESRPGAPPARVTSHARGELMHVLPQLVASDRVMLFTVKRAGLWGRDQVVAQDLATGARTVVLDDAVDARYVPSGHLLFLRRGLLMAVPFDLAQLRVVGEPVPVVNGVAQALIESAQADAVGAGQFAVSATGALAYVPGDPTRLPAARLISVDRSGRIAPLPFEARNYSPALHVSPDGRRLAVPAWTVTDAGLWIADLSRGTMSRLPSWGEPECPRWSPDGQWVAFVSLRNGAWELARQRTGGDEHAETVAEGAWFPTAWSPDGRSVAAYKGDQQGSRIWMVPIGQATPLAVPVTESSDLAQSAAISPDGRWLAYSAQRTGRREVYVRPHPGQETTTIVSNGGGMNPVWNPKGGELFFVQRIAEGEGRARMMAARVREGGPEAPHPLFEFRDTELLAICSPFPCYAVAPGGDRFYMTQPIDPGPTPPVTHVTVMFDVLSEIRDRTGR